MEEIQSLELKKPQVLYHASENRDILQFEPRNRKVRDPKEGPQVFATPSKALATVFLVPCDDSWGMSGLINGTIYKIISDEKRFKEIDKGGAIYHLPPDTFTVDLQRGLREFEYTSKVSVIPINKEIFESALDAMIDSEVQVYFVNQDIFQELKASKNRGSMLTQTLQSENQKRNKNIKDFE